MTPSNVAQIQFCGANLHLTTGTNMIKTLCALALCSLSMSLPLAAVAGEIHYGNGSTREAACSNADQRARRAADSNNTCYTQCDVRKCTKETDGSFTCRADSAHHKGSCGNDKIRRN